MCVCLVYYPYLLTYTRAVDSHLIIIRRLSQTISDVTSALEAKLSVLDTLHTLHKKLQSHDLLFRELAAGQEHLLYVQQKLSAAQEAMAAKQGAQMKDVLRVLDQIQAPQVAAEVIAVKDSQPQPQPQPLKSKRQRRLLSDEEMAGEYSAGAGYRQLSVELLPFVEAKEVDTVTGAVGLERPPKRKLLNTMDLAQFAADDF